MNRRLLWTALAAAATMVVAAPLLAQTRTATDAQGALAEHKAQEQREHDAAAERAKRREAARKGQDSRHKARTQGEEEEEERDRR